MSGKIIDGKALALSIRSKIADTVCHRKEQKLPPPCLATILIGENPASQVYVKNKRIACEKAGFLTRSFDFDETVSEEKILMLIQELNQDPTVHGILVQLPLPMHFNKQTVIETIAPQKDVDGFHPYNLGRLAQNNPLIHPCTPYGVMQLLATTQVTLTGKDIVMVGASQIVGLPLALELLNAGCTPTICHNQTKDLETKIKQADIVLVAVGHPGLIKGKWIKKGAIVIDIGINRLPDGHLIGDVEFDAAKKRASWITPVPGGVGPMTVATLLSNTLQAAELADQQN